jgi:hypothetical protein
LMLKEAHANSFESIDNSPSEDPHAKIK